MQCKYVRHVTSYGAITFGHTPYVWNNCDQHQTWDIYLYGTHIYIEHIFLGDPITGDVKQGVQKQAGT